MSEMARLTDLDEKREEKTTVYHELRETAYRWLLPRKRHAYYIVAPQYTRYSAGIKSLHMLCNALNRAGERAYLITYPFSSPEQSVNPWLLTPLLTRSLIGQDYAAGLTPIVVYPEVVRGNPFDAPFVVRYVLNYPGLLGGDKTYPEDEFCIAYSHELASVVPDTQLTLFVPASDPSIFTPEPRVEKRSGSCFYAGKYQEIHAGKLFDVTRGSVEIYRSLPRAQSQEEIADLFRGSEVFYAYENTALVIEALMCECPVVFLPNPYLTNAIAAHELGWDGIAWGADESEIARAKATVKQGRENYLRLFDEFARVLPDFIKKTQQAADIRPYEVPIQLQRTRFSDGMRLNAVNQDAAWIKAEAVERPANLAVLVRGMTGDEMTTANALGNQWVAPKTVQVVTGSALELVNRAVLNIAEDWVLFLCNGDICDPALVATLMRSIERHPEWEMLYLDDARLDIGGEPVNQNFKPDFNLDYLRSMPYTGASFAVRRDLFDTLGGFDACYEGVEEYDFTLRAYERVGGQGIGHLSGAMIRHKPGASLSARPLQEVLELGRQALAAHIDRLGMVARVLPGRLPATYRVQYLHATQPLVSIIVTTRDEQSRLQYCLESLLKNTAYPNYEILIVDNDSSDLAAVQYISGLRALEAETQGRIRVLSGHGRAGDSSLRNFGARAAKGDYLLFIGTSVHALHSEWLDNMMAHAQRAEVGVVGAKLIGQDDRIQHAGVVLGLNALADRPFAGREATNYGYYMRLMVDQNYSAVSGDCLLVRRDLFDAVRGWDETDIPEFYSDVDFCLKTRESGYLVVWTPHATLRIDTNFDTRQKMQDDESAQRLWREQCAMYTKWLGQMAHDPAYNRCLSLRNTEFEFELDEALCWDPEWRPVPRIITQPADRMGCGEYRIIAPTRALIDAGRIQGQETDRIYTPPELARIKPDTLVLQRQVEPFQIEAIERHKRFNPDVFCVFEIDDLITNVPIKNAHRSLLPKDMYKRLRKAIASCDRLVVATEPLAEAYSDFSSDIRVVSNYIEAATWNRFEPERRVGSKPRVGWAGGVSHTGDLELIAGVVEALKDEVEWVFLGMCPAKLRPYIKEYHEPVPIGDYPAKLASLNLDLAVAPLEDVPFNHAKSHLRLLEYGALGYPVVCSDLTPYQGEFPVMRVRNRFKDWVDAIRSHIQDRDASAEAGDQLRDHVRKRWLLENNLDVWLSAWLP